MKLISPKRQSIQTIVYHLVCLLALLILLLGSGLFPGAIDILQAQERSYIIHPQGYDSNCDYLAVANGIQNIGGDGEQAYWQARSLVPQVPRDFKEAFYTLLGPNGSDQPFSLDNLGAAPEAFIGMYETMGYNAVFLASTPGVVDLSFAQAIYERLAADPERSFAHLWITPRAYDAQARLLHVDETGEEVELLYPYHEVAAMAAPDSNRFVMLDGLAGYPYTVSLEQAAYLLHGFNRVIVVSRNDGSLDDHQRFQMRQQGQPYVSPALGGPYLTAARKVWGSAYQTWGQVIGQPYRAFDGQVSRTILPGTYVQYERGDGNEVTLAPLGIRMARELEQNGVLPHNTIQPSGGPALINGIHAWVVDTFGSTETFQAMFGKSVTGEFWLTQGWMKTAVLHGLPHPLVDRGMSDGYVCVLTERAMLAWSSHYGTFMLPLGRIYHEQLRAELE